MGQAFRNGGLGYLFVAASKKNPPTKNSRVAMSILCLKLHKGAAPKYWRNDSEERDHLGKKKRHRRPPCQIPQWHATTTTGTIPFALVSLTELLCTCPEPDFVQKEFHGFVSSE